MKLTDENKAVKEYTGQNYFGYGVHKVAIGEVSLAFTDNEKEYIEITVIGENEEEDSSRVWFTSDKSANFSFNILRQIYIHNASEENKDKARDAVDALEDTKGLLKLMQNCIGGECWFTKYPDPTQSYINAKGETKQSINKNVYGYAPKLRTDLLPTDAKTTMDVTDVQDANIPKDWA